MILIRLRNIEAKTIPNPGAYFVQRQPDMYGAAKYVAKMRAMRTITSLLLKTKNPREWRRVRPLRPAA